MPVSSNETFNAVGVGHTIWAGNNAERYAILRMVDKHPYNNNNSNTYVYSMLVRDNND